MFQRTKIYDRAVERGSKLAIFTVKLREPIE